MNSYRKLALVTAIAICPLLTFSTINGQTNERKTIHTTFHLDGKDSIVTTVDGKIVSTQIVENSTVTSADRHKRKASAADSITLNSDEKSSTTAAAMEHEYKMKRLENEHEMAKLKLKSQEEIARINASKNQDYPYKQTISILLICIGLPLLLIFGFLGYRLKIRNKRTNDFEKFLIDLAQSGQPISPELVTALRINQLPKSGKRTSDCTSRPSDSITETETAFLDDNKLKAMEKETYQYCARRVCLAATALLLLFWSLIYHMSVLSVLLFLPFVFFLFQAGFRFVNFLIEKRYRNTTLPADAVSTPQGNDSPNAMTPPQPAPSSQNDTESSDTPIQPTL